VRGLKYSVSHHFRHGLGVVKYDDTGPCEMLIPGNRCVSDRRVRVNAADDMTTLSDHDTSASALAAYNGYLDSLIT
jgi:hypothetical protein